MAHSARSMGDPRPGRPASISVEQVEAVVVATLEKTPQNATHSSRTTGANLLIDGALTRGIQF